MASLRLGACGAAAAQLVLLYGLGVLGALCAYGGYAVFALLVQVRPCLALAQAVSLHLAGPLHMHGLRLTCRDAFVNLTSAGLAMCREPLLPYICQSTIFGACCVRGVLMQFLSAQQVMGIWSGLVGMSGGYVATALVMLMSPVFFPVLAIIAPVRSSVGRCFSGARLMPHILYTASSPTHCWVFWHPLLCLSSSSQNHFDLAKTPVDAAPAAQRD